MPKVSVLLSSYNQGKYLAESINSVLNQTFKDFEVLLFDDGSTDNSQEIIRSFSDERIKTFLYEKNRGPFEVVQEPLRAATGKYIAIHHSDDVWEETKLEKQVAFLDSHEEYAACFTNVRFIDETSEIYDLPEDHPYKHSFKQKNRSREEWLNYLFWNLNPFCNPSSLVRHDEAYTKNAAAYASLIDSCLFQMPDYLMWLRVCETKNVYILEENLIRFRLRRTIQDSMSSLSLEKSIRIHNEISFTAKEFLNLTKDKKDFLKIFPEAEKYLVNGKIETKFALAQLCLEHPLQPYKKLGLEILYSLLHNPKQAETIKKLYNYDHRNFIADTGKADVYGMRFQAPVVFMRLYFDFGEDFCEADSIEKAVIINADETFFVTFECPLKSPVKKLRFDPDEQGALSVRLTKILVNGEQVTNFSSNAIKIIDEEHIFLSNDPLFHIHQEISDKNLRVEISGTIRRKIFDEVEKIYLEDLADRDKQIHEKNLEIMRLNVVLNQVNVELNRVRVELSRVLAELNLATDENNSMRNSRSWKITKPLRDAGAFIRKF